MGGNGGGVSILTATVKGNGEVRKVVAELLLSIVLDSDEILPGDDVDKFSKEMAAEFETNRLLDVLAVGLALELELVLVSELVLALVLVLVSVLVVVVLVLVLESILVLVLVLVLVLLVLVLVLELELSTAVCPVLAVVVAAVVVGVLLLEIEESVLKILLTVDGRLPPLDPKLDLIISKFVTLTDIKDIRLDDSVELKEFGEVCMDVTTSAGELVSTKL